MADKKSPAMMTELLIFAMYRSYINSAIPVHNLQPLVEIVSTGNFMLFIQIIRQRHTLSWSYIVPKLVRRLLTYFSTHSNHPAS
jgi:hypothetical protein